MPCSPPVASLVTGRGISGDADPICRATFPMIENHRDAPSEELPCCGIDCGVL
eukprot:CAMPEP_0177787286 /NCGR_PEP_ID=MMETSP0491_2-20121128/21401_1 /TAXON_ID=63592 /ORGANISM="Tetraselmis chuii, Strain PLY429" /LENGTH=52 /DNA_ID=CAMNT_0019308605 /DNA_START=66 /DNA_END=221 /DNA_ORIENTATION=+